MAFTITSSHTGYTAASATYAGPVPASIAESDLIIAQLVSNTSTADTITPPSGWTTIWDKGSGGYVISGGCGIWVGWHLVTAGEAASPPSSWDFGLSTARTGNIIITKITGHNPADVMDTGISTNTGSFSTTVPLTCAAVTSTVAGGLLIGGCVVQSGISRTITEPSGWTEDDSTCTLDFGRGADVAHLVLGAAGSTGAQDWLQSGASLAGAAWMIVVTPSTGIAQAIATTTETDSSIAVTKKKTKSTAFSSETDSAFAVAKKKAKTAGLASSANSALAVTKNKTKTLGLASETDTGLPLTRGRSIAITFPTETDSAIQFGVGKSLGLPTETDAALPQTRLKVKSLGVGASTDAALPVAKVKIQTLGLTRLSTSLLRCR